MQDDALKNGCVVEAALHDFDADGTPEVIVAVGDRVLQPGAKTPKGRPQASPVEISIQALSAALVQTLSVCGWKRHDAYIRVAKVLKDRRVKTPYGSITTKTLQGWFNKFQQNGKASPKAKKQYASAVIALTALAKKYGHIAGASEAILEQFSIRLILSWEKWYGTARRNGEKHQQQRLQRPKQQLA